MTDPRLRIDPYNLNEELIENPGLVQQINDEAAEAIAIRDAKKDALKTVEAELDAELRELLSKTGKVTEKMLESAIQTHPRRKKAFEEWNKSVLTAAKAESLVDAFKTRSIAIIELCKLLINGYYAADSVKRSAATNELQYSKARERLADKRTQR
jgi:hypothetical protein